VLADGHAVAVAEPVAAKPGGLLPDTRALRSEHLELEMKPDGRDLQEIRSSTQAQLEFKPNQPAAPHRVVDASRLRVLYGEGSYVQTFLAWNAVTRTDKPTSAVAKKTATGAAPPSKTWSDELTAQFQPNSNQVATIDQAGNFRYEEGPRRAFAKRALFDQTANRMTLIENARVQDDTGSATADKIVMSQSTGDMDASGHVFSTHEPDKNEKPGTSMLDKTKSMQAKAETMTTREDNALIHYQGHAVIWQGANKTTGDSIDIDRNESTLHAKGNVVSELLDKDADTKSGETAEAPQFTTVFAPEMLYRDDKRIADYTGGVKMIRNKAKTKMTITSKELLAFLTPKTEGSEDDSSLDHAVATGDVTIYSQLPANRTRTSTAEHCEYWAKEGKVVLNGGSPQMVDSFKGVTRGEQLTYFNDDDRLMVDGKDKRRAYTQMKIK
jgi:lipopolysaccharide export system protein LptA